MKNEPLISFVVVGFYQDNNFIKCMQTLTTQLYNNYEIVLVWSKKDPILNIQSYLTENKLNTEKIRIYGFEENLGFSIGYNIAVEKANGDYVIIINPDVEISPNFIEKLFNTYLRLKREKRTEKIIIGPRICNPTGILEFSRRTINFLGFSNPDYSKTSKIRRTMITSGCCFLIEKQLFQRLHGFDEEYFMYHEDIDFSIRASMIDCMQYVDNSIRLLHLKNDEGYKLGKFKYFYHERNRLMMCLEHAQNRKKMLLVQLLFEPFHLVFAIGKGFLRERIKIFQYLVKNMLKIWRSKEKQNNIFDNYYSMEGIFNEVDSKSITFRFLNFYAKLLFYLYKL
ncbi:hypothetical protein NEF87_004267 [Candidatus Lokiarchaeum ossiferum]|uniref:Glycosyltransferase 2-like domain-containing protein n=1 Tax=Candidatus Lokiarchaeum ossiferum TaxID=2951803 RepID=A0ABY6HYN7_9ARCH|nr:hypothetical protein NEF87_004267 [Candidatus Lokiarchaeum sp. B-35]